MSARLLRTTSRLVRTPFAFRPLPSAPIVQLQLQRPIRTFASQAAATKHAGSEHGHGEKGHGAGEHHDDGHHGGVEYEGLTISKPKTWQTVGAQFFGGLMWFWLLYRFSNDYKVFLGLEHPWDAHHGDEHHDEHADEGHDSHAEKKHH